VGGGGGESEWRWEWRSEGSWGEKWEEKCYQGERSKHWSINSGGPQ
jgi:hypothetical protein